MAALAVAGALGAWAAVIVWRKTRRPRPAGKTDGKPAQARAVVAEARAAAPLALPPPLPPALPPLPASLALTALDLSRSGLAGLPEHLGSLAPKLIKLNVQGNPALGALPDSVGLLKHLTLLGAARCGLGRLPDTIGGCTALKELYLTGNDLVCLPASLAACKSLQKVQASFNPRLRDLGGLAGPPAAPPPPALEMLRVACCGLEAFPPGLARAPKLCWVSYAGNPGSASFRPRPARGGSAPTIPSRDVRPGAALGAGASGDVCVATLTRTRPDLPPSPSFALKTFRADVGPDGAAVDEVAVSRAIDHPALSRVLAVVRAQKSKAASPPGLLLELVPGAPLADRPNGDPLLRPHWRSRSERVSPARVLRVAASLAGGLAHCHARGLAHGDFYAHNVLLRKGGGGAPAVLVDWGAAFAYRDPERPSPPERASPPPAIPAWAFEAFEARAYGLFLGQLAAWAGLAPTPARASSLSWGADRAAARRAAKALRRAEKACLVADPAARPPLASLERELSAIADQIESML